MNSKIAKQLRRFEDRITGRLERENRNDDDDGFAVLRGTGAKFEISDRVRATGSGGVALIHEMVKSLGLNSAIDDGVHLLKLHRPYHESDHVLSIAYNLLAGGRCLQDMELLRNDENYLDALGARRIPDPTTAGDFCRRFKSREAIDALQESINGCRVRVWQQQQDNDFHAEALIDADGTIVEASDCTEGADMSRKKTFGFQPLLITLANTQEVLSIDNRPASQPASVGAAARLDEAVSLVKAGGFRAVTLRGDTEFSQTQYLDGWNARGVRFVFGYGAYSNLEQKADSLDESAWQPLERGSHFRLKTVPRARPENVRERVVVEREYLNIHLAEEHVAEFDYKPKRAGETYRMVVVRKRLTHERGGQLLYDQTRYLFYITNRRSDSPREIVRLANTRCGQERLIGIQKSDVRSLRCPLDNLYSNWAYMVCATLGWNLAKWCALLLPERGRWKRRHAAEKRDVMRMNFSTFVTAFMRVPVQVVRTARGVRLRLLAWNPWQKVFFRALRSVQLAN